MAKALTARMVEQVKPREIRIEVPDGLLAGLYLVVQPSGSRSWALRYRHAGKPRKLTLGGYPALSLADARLAAKDALVAAARGADPAGQKVEARRQARAEDRTERDLFETVAADFIARYAKPKNRGWFETDRLLRVRVTPHWRGRKLQDITRRDVVELLDGIVDEGKGTTANRVLAAIRKLFNWSVERGILDVSPCNGIRAPAKETSRERVLSDDEVRFLWTACEAQGYPFGPLVRLLLLTGQRRDEVANATWAEVSLEEREWALPAARAKNGKAHAVPLSTATVELLTALPRIAGRRNLIFTTTGASPVSGFSRAKAAIDQRMNELARQDAKAGADDTDPVEIPHWTLHDLRRTAATGMARLGVAVHVVEAILNHQSGKISGVARIYNRHSYTTEKHQALEAWAQHVNSLIARSPADQAKLTGVKTNG